jgi:hypothetical protein
MLTAIALSMFTSPFFGSPTPSSSLVYENRVIADMGPRNIIIGLLAGKMDLEELTPVLDEGRPCVSQPRGCPPGTSFSVVPCNGTVLFVLPASMFGL